MNSIKRLFETGDIDLRLAAYAAAAIVLAVGLEALIGVGALQTGVAAVVVAMMARAGDLRTRIVHMAAVTAVGGAFGFFAYVSAETAWQAAIVLGSVSYVTGLAYGFGEAAGRAGYFLLLWSMAVLIGEAHGGDPPETAAAFLVGGIAAMAVVGAATILQRRFGEDPEPSAELGATSTSAPSVAVLARSGLGVWSLVRAGVTVVAVVLGYQLTSDLDPFWTALTVLIVFQPDQDQTLFKAAQRGLGTLVGVLTATAVLELISSELPVVLIMVIALVSAIAFYKANYLIYSFFLTNAVVLYYWLAVDQEVSDPGLRLAATLAGIALALCGMALVTRLKPRSPAKPPSEVRPQQG